LIVFVCPHGSAKSVVAARFFNRMAGEMSGYRAVARGIEPEPTIPAYVRGPIRKDGFEIGIDEKPVPLDPAEIRSAATVVCIKCKLPQPYAALARQELHWSDVPDFDAGYDAARDKILAHLKEFMAQLATRPQ
jgi:protein-tyrosine-phosphatase